MPSAGALQASVSAPLSAPVAEGFSVCLSQRGLLIASNMRKVCVSPSPRAQGSEASASPCIALSHDLPGLPVGGPQGGLFQCGIGTGLLLEAGCHTIKPVSQG